MLLQEAEIFRNNALHLAESSQETMTICSDTPGKHSLAENRSARQLLAQIGDSGSYRVALVSSAQNSARDMVLLPLTGKDIEGFIATAESNQPAAGPQKEVRFGDVCVDFCRMQVRLRGRVVYLSTLGFKCLKFLIQNAERPISRDQMLNHVWGFNNYPCTRTVDNQLLKLRKKLEADPRRPVHFLTLYGLGYKFVP